MKSPLKVAYSATKTMKNNVQKFLSVDPLAGEFPWQSPYSAFDNNPIVNVDPDGRAAKPSQAVKEIANNARSADMQRDNFVIAWHPDGGGNLVADEGDNAKTLATYYQNQGRKNISNQAALDILYGAGYQINDKKVLNLKTGDKVQDLGNWYDAIYSGWSPSYNQLAGNPYKTFLNAPVNFNVSSTSHNSSTTANNSNNSESNNTDYSSLVGPSMILLGQPLTLLKPVGALGSSPGSSLASWGLSKAIPYRFTTVLGKQVGTRVASTIGTNVMGRAMGRFVPVVGWGWTIGTVLYDYEKARENYKPPVEDDYAGWDCGM